MTLALAAAKQGITSHVVDKALPEQLTAEGTDGRASAISTASWNLFGNIGLAERLEPLGCSISAIAVTDGMKPGRIDFQPKAEEGSLGRMFANRDIRLALFEAARAEPAIAWSSGVEPLTRERGEHGVSVTLSDGRILEASLLVGAEGRQSPTRADAGLNSARWDYRHRAFVTAITHARPHDGVAWEIFYPAGPLALLPLLDLPDGRHRSAVVWTVDERDADGISGLSDAAFLSEIVTRMESVFGAAELAAPRMSYPLNFHHAARIVEQRLALVGDAAHGMHPIAGQGLNLGLRDVGCLVEVLADGMRLGLDPGDAQLLARYERWRSLDSVSVMATTDALVRIFGIPGRLPSMVRRLGMGLIQRSGWMKRFFMDEARGMSGQLPTLLKAQ
jgi:2-octaprenyl-6-methoxyphenol hydroxylase